MVGDFLIAVLDLKKNPSQSFFKSSICFQLNDFVPFAAFVTTEGVSLNEVNHLLAGEIGSPVILRLERPDGNVKDVGLVRGLLPSSDPYMSTLAGIGLSIEVGNSGCSVLRVVPGGSANRCGQINAGDLLQAVRDTARSPDFIPVAGLDMDDIRSLILGPSGSHISLRLERPNPWPIPSTVYVCDGLTRGNVSHSSTDTSPTLLSSASSRHTSASPPNSDTNGFAV
jgi:hypothetical protein